MKKINVLWIILDLIFLVIFNAFFFLLSGAEHGMPVWMSYGFIHFAYFMLLLTPFLIRKGKSSAVFGFSLYSISSAYFLIELITGIVFMLVFPENFAITLLVQLSIAGLYCIILISSMIANEHTANAEQERQHQIEYIKEISLKLKLLLEKISDKDTKKMIEKIYDAVSSSPVKSHPNIANIESNMLQSVAELETEISAGNKEMTVSLANSLLAAVNERNTRLKTLH